MQVDNSGREVPSATIDIPITTSLTPNILASSIAPLTNKSAPKYKPIIPSPNSITALPVLLIDVTDLTACSRFTFMHDQI